MSSTRLTITVVRAYGLPPRFFSTVQPYVLIAVDENTTFETTAVTEESSPRWDESFTVNVRKTSSIRFGVFNSRNSQKRDRGYIGGVWFTVQNFIDLGQSGNTTHTLELKRDGSWLIDNSGWLVIQLRW